MIVYSALSNKFSFGPQTASPSFASLYVDNFYFSLVASALEAEEASLIDGAGVAFELNHYAGIQPEIKAEYTTLDSI